MRSQRRQRISVALQCLFYPVTDADFSDTLIDRVDQRSLCRDAEGTNPVTGVDTRLSLGC